MTTYYSKNSGTQKKLDSIILLAIFVLNDYFHKCIRYIADYCRNDGINRVIIGDITGIRKGYDKGDRLNQQFHSLPYAQIYTML